MSERMTPMPFEKLMRWMLEERASNGTVFGINAPYVHKSGESLSLFRERLETPFGPAAGPNTQLAQNLIAAYYAGARFFELKTVQKMDGAELAACIGRPCILAEDEGYNCEWSTELTVPQAFDEYVKAYFAIKLISRRWGLGDPNGFMFNMSVGYDLAGIKTPKMDAFIEGLRDASQTPVFQECRAMGKALFPDMAAYIDAIPARVCDSVTISTLHGCPPQEIESIAAYLLTEKRLNTFVKCNPTILGYAFARARLDEMGYDYIAFDDHHFKEDLQYTDAVPMFHRLLALAEAQGLAFGLKLSNTFPVDVKNGELPSEEMYMSGRALYPLTIEMANRFAGEFQGKLRLSFSGGAEFYNIQALFEAGVWPITMATTLLKPGGYGRLVQLAALFEDIEYKPFTGVDYEAVAKLSAEAVQNPRHVKPFKTQPGRGIEGRALPMLDCYTAPCMSGCPFGQDIPAYIELCGKGLFLDALKLITDKNPLPFVTGTICAHHCMDKCMRNHYEAPVDVRGTKLAAAEAAYVELMALSEPVEVSRPQKLAVVGGGPAGLAAAYFAAKMGMQVTVFEKSSVLGGIVRSVIPSFRITDAAIDRDVALIKRTGAEFILGKEAPNPTALEEMGYDHILLAFGAQKKGTLNIEGNVQNVMDFLETYKSAPETLSLGKHVAVVGGGNSAMDAARAAKRVPGVEKVCIVYRRTKHFMPAEEEELKLAMAEGVEFMELLAPVKQADGKLICKKMILGEKDESGRQRPVETGESYCVDADTVIAAVGERVDAEAFLSYGISFQQGKRQYGELFVIGDASRGPATVAEAIADAKFAIEAITGEEITGRVPAAAEADRKDALLRKIQLSMPGNCEAERCLSCNTVCECCVSVCPNRANVAVSLPGKAMRQILHVDFMCNECGNCATFCPYSEGRPYKDKFSLFGSEADFMDSENSGFLPLPNGLVRLRYAGHTADYTTEALPAEIAPFIRAVMQDYAYLL